MIKLTPKELLAKFKVAKDRRNQSLWTHLYECYQYAAPQRETFFQYVEGQKKNTDLYDDTAIFGTQIFANRMQKAIVPPWQKWSLLVPGQELSEDEKAEVVEYNGEEMKLDEALEAITDTAFNYIHRSNFSSRVYESFIDFAISTGTITCEYSDDLDELIFNAVPLSQLYVNAGVGGEIVDHWREQKMEYGKLLDAWPQAELDAATKSKIKTKPKDKVTVVDGCIKHDNEYYYVVILKDIEQIIFNQDEEQHGPFISFRGMVVPGEIYGRGPIMQLLITIKTLNKVKEFELVSGAIAAAGLWTGRSDGVFNPYTIQVAPGVVIPVQSNNRDNPALSPVPMNFEFQYNHIIAEKLEDRINKALFAEPLGSLEDPSRTAHEMQLRYQMHMEDSGAFFARVQVELVEQLMKRVLHVLKRAGKIPDIQIDGKAIELKHVSPIARSMDQEDLQNLQMALQEVSMLGEQAPALTFEIDDVGTYIAQKRGVDAKLISSKAQKEQKKEKLMEAAQAMAENV